MKLHEPDLGGPTLEDFRRKQDDDARALVRAEFVADTAARLLAASYIDSEQYTGFNIAEDYAVQYALNLAKALEVRGESPWGVGMLQRWPPESPPSAVAFPPLPTPPPPLSRARVELRDRAVSRLAGELDEAKAALEEARDEIERLRKCESVEHHEEHHAKEQTWLERHKEVIRERDVARASLARVTMEREYSQKHWHDEAERLIAESERLRRDLNEIGAERDDLGMTIDEIKAALPAPAEPEPQP